MFPESIDQRQLVYFLATARHQNMRRAADELDISESTLSRSIGRLEAFYGVPLFDRLRRGLRLNDYGRALCVRVERAMNELMAGQQELRTMREAGASIVALAFLPKLGAHVVPNLLMAFKRLRPDVRFRLRQCTDPELRDLLLRGDVDLCIAGQGFYDQAMDSDVLRVDTLTAVVSEKHPLAGRAVIDLRDIAGEPLLTYHRGRTTRNLIEDFSLANNFALNVIFESNEFHALTRLAAVGYGVAIVPDSARDDGPHIVTIPLRPALPVAIGLFALRGRVLSPTVRAFRDFALGHFASHRAAIGTPRHEASTA